MRRFPWVFVGLFVFFVSACVFPKPPPGVPVPDLVVTADKADPVAGILTITATPVNVALDHVEFALDGGAPFAVDATPPYSVTIDTVFVAPRQAHREWDGQRRDLHRVSAARIHDATRTSS